MKQNGILFMRAMAFYLWNLSMISRKAIQHLISLSIVFCLSEFSSAQVNQDSTTKNKDTTSVLPAKHEARHADTAKPLVHKKASPPKVVDSSSTQIPIPPEPAQIVLHRSEMIDLFKRVLSGNPNFNFLGHPLIISSEIHQAKSYSQLFYFLIGLLSISG
jgi:hypothetical protein